MFSNSTQFYLFVTIIYKDTLTQVENKAAIIKTKVAIYVCIEDRNITVSNGHMLYWRYFFSIELF